MKTNLPKISIITPSYNQGQFIEQTITSVLDQKYPNLEYWVIDGGSTDDTIAILKRYSKKIKWISEKDKGQADAINKGLQKSTGEIVAYLNSDDCLIEGCLHLVGKTFNDSSECNWLTGDYRIIDQDGHEIQKFVVFYKKLLRIFPNSTVQGIANGIAQPSTFWRRTILDEVGFFDITLKYCMDYDFWQRIFLKHSLIVLPHCLSKFRIHKHSKGGSQFEAQFTEECMVLKRYNHSLLIHLLHRLHAILIILIYRILK